MPDFPDSIEELDAHISAVRENLRDLIARASAYSGAADEELVSRRIAEQEAQQETGGARLGRLGNSARQPFSVHSRSASSAGQSDCPQAVRRYSTFGGT